MKRKQGLVILGWMLACVVGALPAQAARLAEGTAVRVRLKADLLSSKVTIGTRIDMEVAQPVMLHGAVAIPAGATVWGGVQEVKPGKLLRIDVEGMRLPNNQIVKLRCGPQRVAKAYKDELRVESQVSGDVGAAKGTEFVAYLDQDVDVDAGGAPAAPTPAPVVTPPPAPPQPTPPPPAPSPEPTTPPPAPAPEVTPAPAPVVTPAPPAPPPAAVVRPAAPAQPGELVRVECYSDPTHADIIIDNVYHGSTPSILKLAPGSHTIEYRMIGYKPHSQPLDLTPGTGLRTVQMTMEKLP